MMSDTDDGLGARDVVQRFGGALALDGVSLTVRAGEIHALLGENGAGKSTLVKILTGALAPTSGAVLLDGHEQRWSSPRAASSAGVAVVHQDYHLFPALSVADNILAGRHDTPTSMGIVQRRKARALAHQLLSGVGVDIDVDRFAGTLDAAERKLVEIARALANRPRYLVLDEPTAALEPRETDRLLALMRRLAEQGTGLVFVTHRLNEVLSVCDRASVLRDGHLVGTFSRGQLERNALIKCIVGAEVIDHAGPTHQCGEVLLAATGVRLRASVPAFDVQLHRGELVGVVGLLGSGTREFIRHFAGVRPLRGAVTTLHGRPIRPATPRAAQRLGIGYIPEDRKRSGVFPLMSIADNLALARLDYYATAGLRRPKRFKRAAEAMKSRYSIRCADIHQNVGHLSGGNQQKVLFGRWLSSGVEVLLVEEPTQGVDIGARLELHEHLVEFAREGGAVLFVSADLEEVRALSHRILVIHDGELVREFDCRLEGPPPREVLTAAMMALPSAAATSGGLSL